MEIVFVIVIIAIIYMYRQAKEDADRERIKEMFDNYGKLKKSLRNCSSQELDSLAQKAREKHDDFILSAIKEARVGKENEDIFLEIIAEQQEQEHKKAQGMKGDLVGQAEDCETIAYNTILETQKMVKPYFNGYNDLKRFKINSTILVEPFQTNQLELDASFFDSLMWNADTRKFMHGFAAPRPDNMVINYLLNTAACTEMGIAFGYAIRLNRGLLGFVKVTSPSHNKVTNNFDGWLIDFVMFPTFRGKKILKNAVPLILEVVKSIGVEKLHAMVDPENEKSIRLLEFWGFENTNAEDCGTNEATGNVTLLYVKHFD